MSRDKVNQAVQATLEQLVADGREIGVQVCAYLGEEKVVDCWAGLADPANGRAVDGDTLFNVFSVSKAVTATAVHIQAERGLIDYDAPIARYWPEFAQAGKAGVTVRHVLSHTSGVLRMPPEVTPELMTDWDWMTRRIAETPGVYPPGEGSTYQSMTFGWLLGETVRRTDPGRRPFGQFVKDEIADPLGCADLWLGIPDEAEARVARLDASAVPVLPGGNLAREATPLQVDLMPDPFERPYVRRACIPAVGGLFSARSEARVFAMLANGGALDGVRLLSEERVRSFTTPRAHADGPDAVFFGMVIPLGWAGYWLGADTPPAAAPRNRRALCHPGMGGSIGWADLDRKLAVAFCHNRMFDAQDVREDSRTIVGDVIRDALGIA
jgi:CubicO group peptidase (beta-lactamase class C family)